VLVFASCKPKTGGGDTGGKHKLAFVTNNASDFWTIARKGTEKAAKEVPGIE
jgi:ribose transport system substrate-binding protein